MILIIFGLLAVVSAAPTNDNNPVEILQFENQPLDSENHYKFFYELSDGQKRNEEGSLVPSTNEQSELSLSVSGSYDFVAPDGQVYSVQYTADENGFHPSTHGGGSSAPSNVSPGTSGSPAYEEAPSQPQEEPLASL